LLAQDGASQQVSFQEVLTALAYTNPFASDVTSCIPVITDLDSPANVKLTEESELGESFFTVSSITHGFEETFILTM